MSKDYRNCPVCNSNNLVLFLKATSLPPKSPIQVQVTEKHFGLHGDMVRCRRCGFFFVADKKFVKKAISLYRRMSDQAYVQEEKERRLSFQKILENIKRIRKMRKALNILDIGCSTGGLLVEAKNLGWRAFGVEPSIWGCKLANKLHGLTISNSTMESYHSSKKFDVITILDVLEHVENPVFLLRKVSRLLKAEGVICIVTPDFGSFMARILGEKWWGIRLGHLSYFDRKTFKKIIRESGFKVKKESTYTRFFSLYYILVRLFPTLEKVRILKELLKKLTVPLTMFDSFEVYLAKK